MNHLKSKPKPDNPRLSTNAVSSLFFTYARHILVKGAKKELTEDDLYEVLPSFKAEKLGDELEIEWKKLVRLQKLSMTRLLWKVYGKTFLLITFSLVIQIVAGILQQKAIKKFVLYFTKQGETMTKTDGCFYGFSVAFWIFVDALYTENFMLSTLTFSIKMRSGFTSLIYRKVLKMDTYHLSKVSTGKIIDLITKDVNEFEFSIGVVIMTARDLSLCLMVCYVLYTEVGWLCLILVLVICLVILPDFCMIPWTKSLKFKILKWSDERYQQTKEVLNSIKLVKLYLWTEKKAETISTIRKKEVYFTTKLNFWKGVKRIFTESVIKSLWYILLVTSIYFGSQLNAGTLFLLVNSITTLKKAVKIGIPVVLQEVASLITVYSRIGDFLRSVESPVSDQSDMSPPRIKFSNFTLIVGTTRYKFLDFEISKGVTTVTGPLGSGKSSLLKVIAKDYGFLEGDLTVTGNVSYASQEPWLFPSTVRQNILFGKEYNEKRYLEVLRVCALVYDLEGLTEGDKTLVADKGTNLSKGQQVRINLARAVYRNSDIYLLDDCLSNLDVLVADFVFKECIQDFLKDKIVVFVTQTMKYIEASSNVVTLKDGFVRTEVQSPEVFKTDEIFSNKLELETQQIDECDEKTTLVTTENQKQIYTEHKVLGKVHLSTYKSYVFSGKVYILLITLFLRSGIQFLKGTINTLESKWITAEQIIFNNSTDNQKYEDAIERRHKMIYFLPIIQVTAVLLHLLMTKLYWMFAANTSINLHQKLLKKVFNSTMSFFDRHLVGTILNRFSEDLLVIDENVSAYVLHLLNFFVELIGIVLVIATVKPIFLLPCFVLSTLVLVIRMYYLRSARAIKRLEFASRSPLLGHLTATLDGLISIKTSQNQNVLRKEFDQHLDTYTSYSYTSASNDEAFNFFVDICSVVFVGFIVIFFLILDKRVASGEVGLVLSQTILFVMYQQGTYRFWTRLENNMTTVERVLEYTKQNQENKKGFEAKNWPQQGEIEYKNASFSYGDHNVFHNLNFTVKSKEKVAVVGRTGSGKTSLLYSLLRLYKFEGRITIDGVDITTLPLDFYRSRITVIPQDPILFSGTLRDNIDPTGKYTDDEIWTSLRIVKLSTAFGSLEDRISPDNLDLSLGQKQLICFCRALIRKNKIVVMDELTANMDDKTEEMIHEIINEHFKDCSVIMITHKLRYILNFDKILVLEKDHVGEFGSPSSLLKSQNGIFYKMYNNIQ